MRLRKDTCFSIATARLVARLLRLASSEAADPGFWGFSKRLGVQGLGFLPNPLTLSQLGLARRGLCVRVTTESTTLLCAQLGCWV